MINYIFWVKKINVFWKTTYIRSDFTNALLMYFWKTLLETVTFVGFNYSQKGILINKIVNKFRWKRENVSLYGYYKKTISNHNK